MPKERGLLYSRDERSSGRVRKPGLWLRQRLLAGGSLGKMGLREVLQHHPHFSGSSSSSQPSSLWTKQMWRWLKPSLSVPPGQSQGVGSEWRSPHPGLQESRFLLSDC